MATVFALAGAEGLEPSARGFGEMRSTKKCALLLTVSSHFKMCLIINGFKPFYR